MEKVYDDTPLIVTEVELAPDTPYGLVEGHALEAISILGSMTDAGITESVLQSYRLLDENGRDITHNYPAST